MRCAEGGTLNAGTEDVMEGQNEVSGVEVNDDDSNENHEGYDVFFCISGEGGEEAEEVGGSNYGRLFQKRGATGGRVMTNSFDRRRTHVVREGSVGLDRISTLEVFDERLRLRKIRVLDQAIRIECNACTVVVQKVGDFAGYGPVWFHEDVVENITFLSNAQKRFRVSFDSANGNRFVI